MRRIERQPAELDISMLGPDWLGLIYFRIYFDPNSWMTFGGVKFFWFNVVFKLPAALLNRIPGAAKLVVEPEAGK